MSLPLLPGNEFSKTLGIERFQKSHHFDYRNDVSMNVGEFKPGIGGVSLPDQKTKNHSLYPTGNGTAAPAWVAFDRQVLSFSGYFQESVHEKNEERYRIRRVKIYFYLEDDSVQVNEPTVENSGIPQGTLIRRHRVPLPPPNDNKFYTVEYFTVGAELSMYGRVFKLTACDTFTNNFLQKMGVKVDLASTQPKDPHDLKRSDMLESMQPLRPYERIDTLRQFLEHDRHVLRFCCYWDDTENLFGDVREMILHYFLADDTVEIREVIRPNAGRDAVPVFLRRSKLPRNAPLDQVQPGVETARTVLNVCNARLILDSLKTGAINEDNYTDADLRVGNVLNVWGRPLKLVSCDDFTKNYYESKYGVEKFPDVDNKAIQVKKSLIGKQVPPYNGFGSEEDSLCSCAGLIPKPPQRDFVKFMERDRNGLISHVLRLVAVMDTDNVVDSTRRFIISYYMSDDTIAVFEPPQRNSGVIGGKYLERGRVKLPGQEIFKSDLSRYYTAKDFYIGSRPIFNNQQFIIIGADEYALSYMEEHRNEFPMSDANKIVEKIKMKIAESGNRDEICAKLTASDDGSGSAAYSVVNDILENLGLTKHEIITVSRKYGKSEMTSHDIESIRSLVQEKLRKKCFEDFVRLLEAFEYEDMEKSGKLSLGKVKTCCKAFKIPIQTGKLEILLDSCTENDQTDYSSFVKLINWRENPSAPCQTIDLAPHTDLPADLPKFTNVSYKQLFQN